jgi:hypothetical protein
VIPPEQLGWMAAVLDMRGAIIVKRNQTRATPQAVIMVETGQRVVVNRLCAMTGQQVELKNINPLPAEWTRRGCIEHCPEAHIHLHDEKPMPTTSRWTVTGASAAVILHNVRPYLLTWADKNYADCYHRTLEDATLSGRGSGATRHALRRLVGLGWVLPDGWLDELLAEAPAQTYTLEMVERMVDEVREETRALEA